MPNTKWNVIFSWFSAESLYLPPSITVSMNLGKLAWSRFFKEPVRSGLICLKNRLLGRTAIAWVEREEKFWNNDLPRVMIFFEMLEERPFSYCKSSYQIVSHEKVLQKCRLVFLSNFLPSSRTQDLLKWFFSSKFYLWGLDTLHRLTCIVHDFSYQESLFRERGREEVTNIIWLIFNNELSFLPSCDL